MESQAVEQLPDSGHLVSVSFSELFGPELAALVRVRAAPGHDLSSLRDDGPNHPVLHA